MLKIQECQIQRKNVKNEDSILNNNELNIRVPNSKENVKNQESAKLHSIVYSSSCVVDEEKEKENKKSAKLHSIVYSCCCVADEEKKNEETNDIKDNDKEFIKNDSEIYQKKKRSKQEELNELKRSLTLEGITTDFLGIHNYTKDIDVRMISSNNQDSFESMFI